MKAIRRLLLGLSVLSALAGALVLTPRAAHAQEITQLQTAQTSVIANAMIQFETATRWESMQPSWRGRRNAWIAQVRSANSPRRLAALMLELETIMTWEAMYPAWRQERGPWVARVGAAASDHDVAQLLIALETATTWTAMYENRWRPVRSGWLAQLNGI